MLETKPSRPQTREELLARAQAIQAKAAVNAHLTDAERARIRMARISFSDKLTSCGGHCTGFKIELSGPLFDQPENQFDFEDIVLHELAHAATPRDPGHGSQWKCVAWSLGCSGDATHNMKTMKDVVKTPPITMASRIAKMKLNDAALQQDAGRRV